jgi:hypothetical protein
MHHYITTSPHNKQPSAFPNGYYGSGDDFGYDVGYDDYYHAGKDDDGFFSVAPSPSPSLSVAPSPLSSSSSIAPCQRQCP